MHGWVVNRMATKKQQQHLIKKLIRKHEIIVRQTMKNVLYLNKSPKAPKKSFPKNGKPGRFAKTIILKSG